MYSGCSRSISNIVSSSSSGHSLASTCRYLQQAPVHLSNRWFVSKQLPDQISKSVRYVRAAWISGLIDYAFVRLEYHLLQIFNQFPALWVHCRTRLPGCVKQVSVHQLYALQYGGVAH